MVEFVGAFPSTLALDDRNNIVREAEAHVYDVNDTNLASPLPVTDLQGVPFTGGKLVASNGIFPQFRTPAGVLEVYLKSGDRVTQLTDISVPAKAAVDAAADAEQAAGAAETAASAAETARADAIAAADVLRALAEHQGAPLIEDPAEPGLYLILNPAALSEDPDEPGLYVIGGA